MLSVVGYWFMNATITSDRVSGFILEECVVKLKGRDGNDGNDIPFIIYNCNINIMRDCICVYFMMNRSFGNHGNNLCNFAYAGKELCEADLAILVNVKFIKQTFYLIFG